MAWSGPSSARGLNPAINTPSTAKPTPDSVTFSAAATAHSLCKWIYHLTWLIFLSTPSDGFLTFPLSLHNNSWIMLLGSLSTGFARLALVIHSQRFMRIGGQFSARLSAASPCLWWTAGKRSVMQIRDLILSIPLRHPEASNVSLAQECPLFLWLYHLSLSALKCLFCPVLVFPALRSEKWSALPSLLHCSHEQHHSICKTSVNKTKHRSWKHDCLVQFLVLWGMAQKRCQSLSKRDFYDQERYTIQHNKPRALYMTLTPLQENPKLIE